MYLIFLLAMPTWGGNSVCVLWLLSLQTVSMSYLWYCSILSKKLNFTSTKVRRIASDSVGKPVYTSDRVGFFFGFFRTFLSFFDILWFFWLVFGFFLSSVLFLQFWFREPLVFDCMFGFDHWFGFVLGQAALERTLCGDLRYPWRLQAPTPLLVELFGFFADSLVHWSAWVGEYCVWID